MAVAPPKPTEVLKAVTGKLAAIFVHNMKVAVSTAIQKTVEDEIVKFHSFLGQLVERRSSRQKGTKK